MNIFGVGLNYHEHIKEFGGEVPSEPVIFMKSSTAYLPNGKPFFYPGFSDDIHYEVELVVRIGRLGKGIREPFAAGYISDVTVGVDLTARDLQTALRKKGLPWELSKAFDGSAPVGSFVSPSEAGDLQKVELMLIKNGQTVQKGNTADMIFPVSRLISHISQYFTLQTGDLIFTGTPPGVGSVQKGDRIEGFLNGRKLLDFSIK